MRRVPLAALLCAALASFVLADDDTVGDDSTQSQEKVAALQQQVADLQAKLVAANQRADQAEVALAAFQSAPAPEPAPAQGTQREVAWKQRSMIVSDLNKFADWCRTLDDQWVLALVAGLLGLLSLLESNVFFQVLTVSSAAASAAVLCMNESVLYWLTLPGYVQWTIFTQVFLTTVLAALVGWKGFQFVLGGALGLLMAHLSSSWAMVMAWEPAKGALWYSACSILGSSALATGEKQAGAVLGPIIGGLMFASSVGFFATQWFGGSGAVLPWLDCVYTLISTPISAYQFGTEESRARDVGLCFWAVISFFGITRWFCEWPRVKCWDKDDVDDNFRKPLLDDEYDARPRDRGFKQGLPAPPAPPPRNGRRG